MSLRRRRVAGLLSLMRPLSLPWPTLASPQLQMLNPRRRRPGLGAWAHLIQKVGRRAVLHQVSQIWVKGKHARGTELAMLKHVPFVGTSVHEGLSVPVACPVPLSA